MSCTLTSAHVANAPGHAHARPLGPAESRAWPSQPRPCFTTLLNRSLVALGVGIVLGISYLPGIARAAAAAGPSQVAITIYNDNLALVQDSREVAVSAGRQRVEFPGVSGQIRAETVSLQADGLTVIEQNFDFDLLTPNALMQKAVGSTVRIVRTNMSTGAQVTETAQVLAANEGVVLRIGERIEVLRDDGLPVRVLFDRIPPNLRARPTLSVLVDSASAGTRNATLRYLTGGLAWKADYVGLFDERNERLELQGWVTLTNASGVSYENARTQLIAGSPGNSQRFYPPPGNMIRAGSGGQDASAFADFHIYPLPEPTTIAENQTKQVGFIDAPNVQARKVYLVRSAGYGSSPVAQGANVHLRFANRAAAGLGRALPKGVLRLYARDSQGRNQFIGEDSIEHTPEGSDMFVRIGGAFDVTYQPTLEATESGMLGSVTNRMRYAFRNARDVPVTLVFQHSCGNPENKVTDASVDPVKIDALTYEWTLTLPPKGETDLTFAIREG